MHATASGTETSVFGCSLHLTTLFPSAAIPEQLAICFATLLGLNKCHILEELVLVLVLVLVLF
jgi:hypothetical protein